MGRSAPHLSGGGDSAQLLVVHQFSDGGMLTTDRALRITPDADFTEAHGQRIVHQQATDEGFAFADDEFDGFCSLNYANDPGQNSQDAGLASRGHHTRWRRRGE